MPNINDINGVTVANLAKLDAVLKANISTVNGLTLSAAAAFLLDTYTGAAAAYSTRKLKTGVTVAARIRRSGDDIEADVEFDSNNEISLTSPISNASSGTYTDLADFVDHSTTPRDAFVDEWKDQSGSGNHAAQATAANQPKLYDATTGLVTKNGKPATQFRRATAGAYHMTLTSTTMGTVFQVVDNDTAGLLSYSTYNSGGTGLLTGGTFTGVNGPGFYDGTVRTVTGSETGQTLLYYRHNGSLQYDVAQDGGSTTALGNTSAIVLTELGRNSSNLQLEYYQEMIVWTGDESSNRTGIETNINSDYLIYQPTDAPTSGLLSTYTGAAAAYSVRQLSDKAVIALRIRRDSDDEERNIGFDSNGDLATADISAFCGTANGYVVEWADQSTNGNHATQSTAGNQPQIYDGSQITVGGKPAIKFLGQKRLSMNLSINVTDANAFYCAGSFNLGKYVLQATNNTGRFFGAIENGSTSGTEAGFTVNSYHVNGTEITSPNRDKLYDAMLDQGIMAVDYSSTNSDNYQIGYISGGFDNMTVQEVIIYHTDKSSDRSNIESNLMTYFSIT